jgi:hypothetical protein
VSKRRRERSTPDKRKLPLNSPNWWTYGKAVVYVRAHVGDKVVADIDLVAAIEKGDEQGGVRSKLEQVQMQYNPPARRSELLTPKFYQRDYKFVQHWDRWLLVPRTDQRLLGRWDVYFWGPDIEKIWPPAVATTTTTPTTHAGAETHANPARGKPGPAPRHDWPEHVTREVIRRLQHSERFPSAPAMLQWCANNFDGFEPNLRQMQDHLRDLRTPKIFSSK